jgi:thiol-disulfide isomerase/thioredoxin
MNLRFTCLLLFITFVSSAQEGYKITCKINELKDSSIYLGYYLEEKTFVKDTARADKNGSFTFQGTKTLPQGIYFLIHNKKILFEMVVGHDQQFSMETSYSDYVGKMIVKGDEDNSVFFQNLIYQAKLQQEAKPFLSLMNDSAVSRGEKEKAKQALTTINEKVIAHYTSIFEKYPKTVTARIIKMNKPVALPEAAKKPDGTIDSYSQLKYYREHFFDNFDLGDELMLRVPKVMYWNKVNEYLTKLFVQHPDSLSPAIDALIAKAKVNKDTYRYLVWHCIVNYQQPEIMGLDEVYVNLVDKYIVTGGMNYWLDKKTVQNLKDYSDKVRRAMIGRPAPNLVMQDEHLFPRSLHDVKNKYTIIFFFKPTCSSCREETPKLVKFYNESKSKFDFEVFAVSTDTSMREMKDFIEDMKTSWITVNGPRSYTKKHFSDLYFAESTPTIYILDDRKKIIARKLGVEQLPDFFENYERLK